MPVTTVEPRLPLEPEEYPLYRPPRRIGCSALTIVALLTVGVFALLLWKVTPQWAEAVVSWPQKLFPSTPQVNTTPGSGAMATTTAIKLPSPTSVAR